MIEFWSIETDRRHHPSTYSPQAGEWLAWRRQAEQLAAAGPTPSSLGRGRLHPAPSYFCLSSSAASDI